MKIEIINKPMLCWDDNESEAIEYHVLAKATECNSVYPYKAISNENTYPKKGVWERWSGMGGGGYKHAKPLPEHQQQVELTLDEIADKFGVPVEQLKIKK